MDGAAGAKVELARIVGRIRARWPSVRILVRADSGFARERLMAWCAANGVDFVLGLARNDRLGHGDRMAYGTGRDREPRTDQPARRFKNFRYSTRKSWSRRRRVIGKT